MKSIVNQTVGPQSADLTVIKNLARNWNKPKKELDVAEFPAT